MLSKAVSHEEDDKRPVLRSGGRCRRVGGYASAIRSATVLRCEMRYGKQVRDFLRAYFGLKVIHSSGKIHGVTMHVSNIGMWEEKYIGDGRIIKHKPVQDFSGTFNSLRELHRYCKREAGCFRKGSGVR